MIIEVKVIMGKIVSFFRHQDNDPGETRAFAVSVSGLGKVEIALYGRGPLPNQVLSIREEQSFTDENKYRKFLNWLRELQAGVGGVLVELRRSVEGAQFAISVSESHGYAPPKHLLVLQLGYPPDLAKLNPGKWSDLLSGSRLLVPVDLEAEQHLESFLRYLRWLSRDVESLVLDSLTRPSLESRIELLEQQAGLLGSRSARKYVWLDKWFSQDSLGRRINKPKKNLIWAVGGLVLIFCLFINWPYFRSLLVTTTNKPAQAPQQVQSKAPSSLSPPPSSISPPIGLAEALRQLESVLSQFEDGQFEKKLFISHFNIQNQENVAKKRSYAYGLVKLLALDRQLNIVEADLDSSALSVAKNLLEQLEPNLSKSERDLLGYFTCDAFVENVERDKAGLPTLGENASRKERVDLPITCHEVKDRADLAAVGLKELTARLEQRLKGHDVPS